MGDFQFLPGTAFTHGQKNQFMHQFTSAVPEVVGAVVGGARRYNMHREWNASGIGFGRPTFYNRPFHLGPAALETNSLRAGRLRIDFPGPFGAKGGQKVWTIYPGGVKPFRPEGIVTNWAEYIARICHLP